MNTTSEAIAGFEQIRAALVKQCFYIDQLVNTLKKPKKDTDVPAISGTTKRVRITTTIVVNVPESEFESESEFEDDLIMTDQGTVCGEVALALVQLSGDKNGEIGTFSFDIVE